jgi:flagellar biosynthesis protein FlhG
LSDFVSGRVRDLSQLMIKTEIPNLSLISGSNDAVNITEMPPFDKDRLIRGLRQLPAQYVILDLGAGTSVNTLDFFLAADQRLIAVTPEPTAIENAYRFLKASFYREMRVLESELKLEKIVEEAMDSKNRFGIRSPSNLLRCVSEMNPNAGVELQRRMGSLKVQIIINQVRTRQDIEVGTSMASVTRKYFGIQADFVGHIDHDNAVWQSLRKRRPLMVEYPYSSIVGQFLRITKHLAHPQPLRAVV